MKMRCVSSTYGGLIGEVNTVNEYGLYNLILASRKKEAKEFKRWITHEVIPSIRKTGGYIANENNMTDDELIAKALVMVTKKLEERDKLIEEQKPKVLFADSVSASNNSILIRDMAKILNQNGVNIGEKRLFQWLRDNGYLIKANASDFNSPTQKSMNLGLFEIKETTVNTYNGIKVNKTPVVTGKGQIYFVDKFKKLLQQVALS